MRRVAAEQTLQELKDHAPSHGSATKAPALQASTSGKRNVYAMKRQEASARRGNFMPH
jgi:hypothetical protein